METKYKTYLIAKIVLVTLLCSILAGSEAEELGVKIERNVPVPMRDGTILRADVHRPDRGGPYPVLVQRTPYGKKGFFDSFVKAGYIVVSQDARGRYDSEGKFESMKRIGTHDAEDGYDTVEWAAHLRGSTGKVGTFGISYPAFLQWRLASSAPPALVAMSASGVPAQVWYANKTCSLRPGIRLRWLAQLAVDMRRHENLPGVHTEWEDSQLWREESQKWLNWVPWLDLPQDFFSYETETLKSWLKNPYIDPWKLDEGCKDTAVPNLDITGWYDHAHGDMLLFRTMVKEAKTEEARKGSRIIIGPWPHGKSESSYGDIDFGPNAGLYIEDAQIRWFDYWLKGKQNGADKDLPVRIFVMGDNEWRDEPHWPLQRARDKILFINSDGSANTPGGNGKLGLEMPESAKTDTYVYDPTDPVPTPWGVGRPLPTDQRSLVNRDDILVYQTELLTERVEVTGNPGVELYASSSTPDTDWFVRLIDVAPDGLARDVSSGMVRARYRDGFDKPKLIRPGEVIKYTIRMNPTSNAFLPGHRIRLDVTSSDFPNFDRNHNTAADQNADARLVTAQQTIHHGGEHVTRIILPWVPGSKATVVPAEEKSAEERDRPQQQQQAYPLHRAAAAGDVEQVKRLISEGVDINLQDEEKKTPLCHAIKAGKIEVARFLVDAGADVNAGLWPPLHVAVDVNDLAMAEYLIAHGAEVNPPRIVTLLEKAPRSSSIEMVELLLDKGADINAGHFGGIWRRAIDEARTDILDLLIQRYIKNNSEEECGVSPLDLAFRTRRYDVAEFLLVRHADFVLARKNAGSIPGLHNAAAAGKKEIAKLCLAKGVDVNEKDDVYEFTALHYAARFGNNDVAEVLIANGADIKAKDRWGYQPIHWAAYHDRPDIVELLIAKGADVNAKTSLGQTPLQLAQERRNTKTVELLRKHGAKESPG